MPILKELAVEIQCSLKKEIYLKFMLTSVTGSLIQTVQRALTRLKGMKLEKFYEFYLYYYLVRPK